MTNITKTIILLGALATTASAQVLVSESFESPDIGVNLGVQNNSIAGFTTTAGSNFEIWHVGGTNNGNGGFTAGAAQDGDQYIEVASNQAALISTTFTTNTTDTVSFSFYHGQRQFNSEQVNYAIYDVTAGEVITFDAANLLVQANGASLVAGTDGTTNSTGVITDFNNNIGETVGPWTQYSGTFDPTAGSTYALVISTETGGANDSQGNFIDDVVVQQIPEPSSTALLGLGGLALIARRKRA